MLFHLQCVIGIGEHARKLAELHREIMPHQAQALAGGEERLEFSEVVAMTGFDALEQAHDVITATTGSAAAIRKSAPGNQGRSAPRSRAGPGSRSAPPRRRRRSRRRSSAGRSTR